MKKTTYITLLGLILSLSACATATRRGTVVMKMSESEAHIGMGSKDIKTGDHVELYRNECVEASDKGRQRNCKKQPSGHGEVTQVLSEDYSIVKFPSGTQFREGDTLEKHSH